MHASLLGITAVRGAGIAVITVDGNMPAAVVGSVRILGTDIVIVTAGAPGGADTVVTILVRRTGGGTVAAIARIVQGIDAVASTVGETGSAIRL
jgi:hypothetical protein